MPLVLKDRVKETSTTTGTGTFTLAGASTGFQAFSVIGDGNTTYYTITDGTDWEVGIGTYTSSGTTLSRDTILESSNSGNAVNWGAGSKDVFVTYPAERSVYTDGAGTAITPAIASVLGVVSGGTGQSTYTDGQLLIGNSSGNTLSKATLTAGTGISVTNGNGSITVAATNNGTVTSVSGTGTVQGITLSGTVTSSGSLTLGGSLSAVDLASQVTGTLPVGNGGTGATTLTANNVILGNGTSAVQFVAPGANGNVLTSNGTTWTSAAGGGGSGDVVGPASATDNAVARFDGTTGKLIQNSAVTIADTSGNITTGGVVLTANGTVSGPSYAASGDTNTGMYFPAADTIGFACGGTEDFRVDGTGQLWNTVQSEVGTDYTTLYKGYFCRAWVRFDATVPSINASGNVSSLTDNAAGYFTVNFATALPDADYTITASSTYRYTLRNSYPVYMGTSSTGANIAPTTSGYVLNLRDSAGNNWDSPYMCSAVFR